ncbi:DnaB-like helicase C-terminal domain-containing protein [Streptomyces sp. WMMB 322]|uniref:DnaB-like helicase C-terminal domain-containing protein n=1 Tax=Streptomyces sp. WMMB 322 TaxID=1286821 RepID=UPI000823CD6D|nr:DnaB-like helicase C-terminal domain-containing protein [Streptomyces sp. WMMB 322]SCK59410.1 DnaB-like helicase C terminal domain-containing protein [Streptomyces sp. WMMB 322]
MATDGEAGPYGTEAARKALFQLLESGQQVVITREFGDTVARAVLTPLDALTMQQRAALESWPAHGLTQARQTLGHLVTQAAGGAPQRLRKRTRDIAVLLPVDLDDGAPPTPPPTPAPAPAGPGDPAAGTVPSTQQPSRPPRRARTLTAPAAALDSLTTGRAPLSYGLPAVDEATGGLQPGRLALIAAAPGVGGSLLAASAAREAAVSHGRTVLYAASGPSATDVSCRIAAAHTGADYQLLRAGTLNAPAQVRAALDSARQAPLWVDDGEDLDTDAIAGTIADVESLALLVVDRLQATADPAVPLSGEALPAVTRELVRLARTHHLPVLAALDTDDPALLARLRADVVLHLERDGETARLTVADCDFAADTSSPTIRLRPDFQRARFLDGPAPAQAPAQAPAPPSAPPVPPLEANSPSTAPSPATTPPTARPAASRSGSVDTDVADQIRSTVTAALEAAGGDADAATNALVKRAVPDVMGWFDHTRKGGRYEHSSFPPVNDLLKKTGQKSGADAVWEGRLNWKNMPLRTDATAREVVALDANAAYLAAFKTHLPIGQLTHDTSGLHDPKRAGIHRITPPTWDHTDLPSPLGDRRKTGDVWITEPTLRLLQRCAREDLCDAPVIRESWTSGATENVLEKLRRTLARVRREAIEAGDEVTTEYLKAAYSKFISTMGESTYNREIRRPDWMHILRSQAFANLWLKARKAHAAGLEVVEATGTDELHLVGDWRQLWTEGRDLSEMKPKHTYTLGGGDQ